MPRSRLRLISAACESLERIARRVNSARSARDGGGSGGGGGLMVVVVAVVVVPMAVRGLEKGLMRAGATSAECPVPLFH